MTRFIESIQIQNLLSFGPDTEPLELGDLNVLIGPNGSGKSNFIEVLKFFSNIGRGFEDAFRDIGGLDAIFWNSSENSALTISFEEVYNERISYHLEFMVNRFDYSLVISKELLYLTDNKSAIYEKSGSVIKSYDSIGDHILVTDVKQRLSDRTSILSSPQIHLINSTAEISDLTNKSHFYLNWNMGKNSEMRIPQRADLKNENVDVEDYHNLSLVLNKMYSVFNIKNLIDNYVKKLYEGAEGLSFLTQGGFVRMSIEESKGYIPVSRLSDGTLRYLSLLAILLNPNPLPLVCIEEPELGLHPDLISTVAELLILASKRTQVIVTTHSVLLVDALTTAPESILVCEKRDGATVIKRLDERILKSWVKDYGLGELWTSGQIGGNRW